MNYEAKNKELFKALKNKEAGALEGLINNNLPYFSKLANKIYNSNSMYKQHLDYEDVLLQIEENFIRIVNDCAKANAAWDQNILVAAANKTKRDIYDQAKQTGDYAYTTILQDNTKENVVPTSYEAFYENCEEKEPFSESLEDTLAKQSILKLLKKVVDELDDEEKLIVIPYFYERKTWQSIADKLGIDYSTCRRKFYNKIQPKMKAKLLDLDPYMDEEIFNF